MKKIVIVFFLFLIPLLSIQAQRCQATTKKGKQCKRSIVTGTNYCWQHQPNYSKSSNNSYSGSHEIHTGPRGGQYYINKNGHKTYIRKKK
jgi:hypothetical protein